MLGLPPPAPTDSLQIHLFAHFYPTAPEAEAFRTLRTNLKISDECKVLMLTSAGPKEGKTTTVANLGVVIGQAGTRVLLIASDLRKPELPKAFGIRRDPGLSEVLSGAYPVDKVIRGFADFVMGKLGFNRAMQTPGLDNVYLLPSGHIPSNPSELIASREMTALLASLRTQYQLIILDSPPILPIADALQMAPLVDDNIAIGGQMPVSLSGAEGETIFTGTVIGIEIRHKIGSGLYGVWDPIVFGAGDSFHVETQALQIMIGTAQKIKGRDLIERVISNIGRLGGVGVMLENSPKRGGCSGNLDKSAFRICGPLKKIGKGDLPCVAIA